MSFEFSLPSFHPEQASLRQVHSYLYQTVQQLNWAMKHLEGSRDTGEVSVQVPAGRGSTPATVSGTDAKQLRDLIVKSAEVADAMYMSLGNRMQGRFVAQSEFGTFTRETELKLEASDRSIEQNYSDIQQISGTLDLMREGIAQTNAYIRTGLVDTDGEGLPVYGLEIGQANLVNGQEVFSKYARFSSSRLSFYDQNDTEVAYISDYRLYITNVQITGTLTVGEYEIDTTDGLAFRWTGG